MARIYDVCKDGNWEIVRTDEYKAYLAALCRLASDYIAPIRVKFAERAFGMYANETVRKLVLAYGEEVKKLDVDRLRDFDFVSEHGAATDWALNDNCLNNAKHYGKAIWFLFGIDDKEDGNDA